MRKLFCRSLVCLLLFCVNVLSAQDLRFTQVTKNVSGAISDMAQDKLGFLWIVTYDQGLKRYDGTNFKVYTNDPHNPNSLVSGLLLRVFIDAENVVWIGTVGSGLDKFDPATNTFTHFRRASGLSSDTVAAILEDHLGNLWVGTSGGLDMLDRKTGKFMHYRNDVNDLSSLSHNEVFEIFEDKKGELWIGCRPFSNDPKEGGLNRFDRKTGKFTRYLHDPLNPKTIPDSRIFDLYEDKEGNFWIASTHPPFFKMDRNTEKFTRYYADPMNSGPLSPTPVSEKIFTQASFITEDATGALWVGVGASGMNRYDPVTKKSTHYGYIYEGNKLLSAKDTATGFSSGFVSKALATKDGMFWVNSGATLYKLDNNKITVPFHPIRQQEANSFYCEKNNNILWIATRDGLLRRDLTTKEEKLWTHDPKNKNSLTFNRISAIRADDEGNLWLGTRNGLDKFNPATGKFVHYLHDPKNPATPGSNNWDYLFFDHQKNLWAASDSGISRMDKNTGLFTNYKRNNRDSTGLGGYEFLCIAEDNEHFIWTASEFGAFRLDTKTGKFRKYISNVFIKSICIDSRGIIWAGGEPGLYYYDKAKDDFVLFADQHSTVSVSGIINVLEDDKKNLWVSTTTTSIIKISEDRTKLRKYSDINGVRYSNFFFNDNHKAADGRLFLGEGGGYYSFYPDQLKDTSIAPQLIFSGFKLGEEEVTMEPEGILTAPLWKTDEIRLTHNQDVFSFDFLAIDFISPGDEKYLFMLENYDNEWHDIGGDHRAFFFNIPPGDYTFRVKAVSGDGSFVEKSIRIMISPPWWRSWWAYIVYGFLGLVAAYLIYRYQRSYIIRKERQRTQEKELAQAKEIEKAYHELKTTQQQLIQSEKMASLGELTAGIAHEIQNPLNFVNNFSEVNKELLLEMKDEMSKGNIADANAIANNIIDNEEKISHHGKRADVIVKGMLQHSRANSGQKEPTSINALADEYLRLSYHGLRAKDKSFNAHFETDFDSRIDKIDIIPQDIGRVILNLINNAFYAVDEKKKKIGEGYEPTVSISTKKNNGKVEIGVKDNGNGIPQKVLDKIFQPFFTTKPTGQGTGLGLSLSYDIVKAHGGEIKVNTKEGEGS